jgi:hypothetical protein
MGRVVLALLGVFSVMLVAVLTALVPSFGGSLRSLGERPVRVATRKMGGLIILVVRTIGVLRQVLLVIVLVAVLTTLVPSFGRSLRAFIESTIWIATRQVRRGLVMLVTCTIGALGRIMVVVVLVAVQAAFVTCLSSGDGAFGEGAIRVATVALELFGRSLFGGG